MIEVIQGDITKLEVNAANSSLLDGCPVHVNTIHNAYPYFIGVFE